MRLKTSSILSIFIFLSGLVFSQNYPVQTTIQLTPPYTSYLPDYTDGVNSKLQVALNITDVNEPILQVKLKITLEGPGGKIVTNPNFVQSPITLNFGEALILSGDELSPYLAFQNLVFPSQTFEQNYRQTKVLPEGLWKLCVDVVDASNPNSELLSTNNCALIFVARLQPPMLNIPLCESTVPRAQNIFFSWTDMALGSQAIGQEPLYDFSLYSVPLSAYNNPTQVLNTNPIFTTTTTVASFSLDTNEVLLPAGQKYLWQVKAKLPDGSGAYLNNGLSAPCTFVFGDLAQEIIEDLTINLTAQGSGPTFGTASWTLTSASGSSLSFDSYILNYRKAGNPDFVWYEDSVTGNQFDIKQLEDSTQYEVKIKGIIGDRETEFTQVVTFMTLPYPRYACGDGNIRPLPPTYTPLPDADAITGIKVAQGQFYMDVTSIEPIGGGHFKGKGKVKIDFLFTRVKVEFDDLLIDDQFNAREGTIRVTTKGLDAWLHEQYKEFVDPTYINGVIDSVYVTDSTAFVIVNGVVLSPGYTFNPPDYPIIFQDDDGTQYTVLANGEIEVGTFLDVDNEYLDVNKDKTVSFEQATNEVFGFDKKEFIQWHENYQIIHAKDTANYFVANKSMGIGSLGVDKVLMQVPKNYTSSEVNLITLSASSGDAIKGSVNSSDPNFYQIEFTLPIIDAEDKYEFYAYMDGLKIGKLNVHAYELITKKVYVVPLVNNYSVTKEQLETELQKTIGEANIKVDVEIKETFSNADFTATTTFGIPDASLLSKYTSQMRQLRDAYIDANSDLDEDALLLFVVSNLYDSLETKSIDGYMVRGRSMGFINSSTASIFTYPHEIGHGLGGLEHSWKNNGPVQGITTNLMDYTDGEDLIKEQWESLRDPGFINTLWDEEEDAESLGGYVAYYFWKMTEDGYIEEGTIDRPFRKNKIFKKEDGKIEQSRILVKSSLMGAAPSVAVNENEAIAKVKDELKNKAQEYSTADHYVSNCIFYNPNEGYYSSPTSSYSWKGLMEQNILYFNVTHVNNEDKYKFSHSDKILKLETKGINDDVSEHLMVFRFYNSSGAIVTEIVKDYNGKIVNYDKDKNIALFVGGYRDVTNFDGTGGIIENNETTNKIYDFDVWQYWYISDKSKLHYKIGEYLKTDVKLFADGHHYASTSNFATHDVAIPALFSTLQYQYPYPALGASLRAGIELLNYDKHVDVGAHTCSANRFHQTKNTVGFETRRSHGEIAGEELRKKLNRMHVTGKTDVLDIICHSMGWAYSVGIIEFLKETDEYKAGKFRFGKLIIIAPENPNGANKSMSYLLTLFEEVKHFGSLGPNDGSIEYCKMDGVAPQSDILGLGQFRETFPAGTSKLSFGESHFHGYYKWILNPIYLNKRL